MNDNCNETSEGNPLLEFIKALKSTPALKKQVESGINSLGNDPIPKIIDILISDPENRDNAKMCNIWLAYLGEPAIPYLIELFGNRNFSVGMFAAETLCAIPSSLPYITEALKDSNSDVRYHAVGAIQGFGHEAQCAIPELSDIIRMENGSKISGIASAALGRIGKRALPAIQELLQDQDREVRLSAAFSLSRVGKPAIPLLYEAWLKEHDEEILRAINNINLEMLGSASDEFILPPGICTSMIDLIEALSMNSLTIEIKPEILAILREGADPLTERALSSLKEYRFQTPGVLCGILMTEVGEHIIPSLVKMMGMDDKEAGRVVGDTLAAIGAPSVPYLIESLNSDNLNLRTNATGALLRIVPRNDFGTRTDDVIAALCGLIKRTGLDLWDIAIIASGTLANIGQQALPSVKDLLLDKSSFSRLAAVAALMKMGGDVSVSILEDAKKKEINLNVIEGLYYALEKLSKDNR